MNHLIIFRSARPPSIFLIHQDYGDHTRKPVIKIFPDRTLFWNPGDAVRHRGPAFGTDRKRNPQSGHRQCLSAESVLAIKQGLGCVPSSGNWRQIGYIPPVIRNDKTEKFFDLVLFKELLLTERQRLFQAQLGVSLSEQEASVFAHACRSDEITLTDTKAVIGAGNREARAVLDRLVTMVLLREVKVGVLWDVAEHLKERLRHTDQATDQPGGLEADLVTDQSGGLEADLVTDQPGGLEADLVTDQPGGLEADLVTPLAD